MSGICAVWRKDNLESLAETVTAVCSGLAIEGGPMTRRSSLPRIPGLDLAFSLQLKCGLAKEHQCHLLNG